MAQTSVQEFHNPAFAGMLADLTNKVVETMVHADSVDIPFGVGVVQDPTLPTLGPTDQAARLPSGSGDFIAGIVMHAHTYERLTELDAAGLEAGATMNVVVQGCVWVTVEATVAAGDRGFCRYSANGGNTQVGAWTNTNDAGHTLDCTEQSRFETSATAGGLAKLRVNFTAKP